MVCIVVREDQRVEPLRPLPAEPFRSRDPHGWPARAAAVGHHGEAVRDHADALALAHVQSRQREVGRAGFQYLEAHGGSKSRQQAEQGFPVLPLPQKQRQDKQQTGKNQKSHSVTVQSQQMSGQPGNQSANGKNAAHRPGQNPARPAAQGCAHKANGQHRQRACQADPRQRQDEQIGEHAIDRH